MPLPGEDRPIVLPIIGKEKSLSRGALHLVPKEIFAMAAERLRARPRMGQPCRGAGHCLWLRHAAGSHMTDQQVDLRFVRDNFGYASHLGHQRLLPPYRGRCAARSNAGASPDCVEALGLAARVVPSEPGPRRLRALVQPTQ